MLRPDIIDLREFYANPLGRAVRRLLRQRLRDFWPDVHGLTVLGLGYATPYLRIFEGEAERVLAAMPGPQGWCAGRAACPAASCWWMRTTCRCRMPRWIACC